jgi:hypothetical protein
VERVLDAMLSGWRSQMLARGLIVNTINARYRVINQFVEFTICIRGDGARRTSTNSSRTVVRAPSPSH